MKHKHYDLIVKYYADMSQKVWFYTNFFSNKWQWIEDNNPNWRDSLEYYIGDQPPKRKITMAGIEFDAPETVAPEVGDTCWFVDSDLDVAEIYAKWLGGAHQVEKLNNGMLHLDRENNLIHSRALIALNKELTK